MSSLSFYISVWFIRPLNTTQLTNFPRCRFVPIISRTSSTVHTEPPHFYSKTNYVHQCIIFISFWNDTLHVSDGLSLHHQKFKTVHTATGICQTHTAVCKQTAVSVWHMPVAVCTVLNFWWWRERPSETCRVSYIYYNQHYAHDWNG